MSELYLHGVSGINENGFILIYSQEYSHFDLNHAFMVVKTKSKQPRFINIVKSKKKDDL